MKSISVLGSTGSVGIQTLDVARKHGYRLCALAANANIERLEQQAREFHPALVCVYDETAAAQLKKRLSDMDIHITTGMDGLCEAASDPDAEIVVNSVSGMIGLRPTLAAIEAGKDVALANKETLVTGGRLVMEAVARKGVRLLPVDSEHSAIFQCLQGNGENALRRILLTASGGPFYGYRREQLRDITPADALKHPNWDMGAKITIDSATLMNKGLELIEAVWLFGCRSDQVEILVHRESVVHSAVEYCDGSVIAQMGVPDMRLPIQYALTYPDRVESDVRPLSLLDYGKLTFTMPDEETFICLRAAKDAIARGGLYPTLVNGANEQAVSLFLANKISFLDIGLLVNGSLSLSVKQGSFTVDDILQADRLARDYVLRESGIGK